MGHYEFSQERKDAGISQQDVVKEVNDAGHPLLLNELQEYEVGDHREAGLLPCLHAALNKIKKQRITTNVV